MQIESWVEKYRPQKLSDVAGNYSVIEELIEWAKLWEKGTPENNAIILYGKQGIGKTTCAHALANEMGWEIMELNASDQRTKTIIEEIAGVGSKMGTTDGSRRLIILDEADNFYSREDKGGEVAVINVILNTLQPMILIANDFYKMKKGLRSSCRPIEFKPIMTSHIMGVLKTIAKSENITYDIGVIEKIADNADGDLRGAINDLQAVSSPHIKLEDVIVGERNNKNGIFIALNNIFRAQNIKESHNTIFNIDQSPEDLIHWVDENIHVEYTRPEDLDDAYYYIAKASTFLARVRRRGNYTMWKYAGFLMSAGVFASSRKRRTEKLRYNRPQLWYNLEKTRNMRKIRDSLSKKIGVRCHTSIGFARSSLLPFFRSTMKNVSYAEYIAVSLELSIEEIAFILEESIEAKIVQDTYNKAQLTLREGKEIIIESSDEINEKIEEEKSMSKYGKAQLNIEDAWG